LPSKLTGRRVVDEIKKCGVTHIIWLPDSNATFMYEAMKADPQFTLVPVCREGEAIAIAAGLLLTGKTPLVLHQCTGLYEAGESLRGFGLELRLPLLMMIGYAGWRRDAPNTNSEGIFLEPVLRAWGINYSIVDSDDEAGKISTAYKEAHETSRLVAVLIGGGRKKS
jgi:sulfopyruvate decarboxylase TPP-binding subunit